jgi:hypothetical protein
MSGKNPEPRIHAVCCDSLCEILLLYYSKYKFSQLITLGHAFVVHVNVSDPDSNGSSDPDPGNTKLPPLKKRGKNEEISV